MTARPRIVCLCGSTRFKDAFIQANADETMKGRIVLTVGRFGHHDGLDMDGQDKVDLDELHKRKIDLADEVLVIDVDGYIGSSTRGEIEYAEAHGKPVRYLSRESVFSASDPDVPVPIARSCDYECKVCAASCRNGYIQHGKGCYRISEDGGGEEVCECVP